jgi:hypothetical protein
MGLRSKGATLPQLDGGTQGHREAVILAPRRIPHSTRVSHGAGVSRGEVSSKGLSS